MKILHQIYGRLSNFEKISKTALEKFCGNLILLFVACFIVLLVLLLCCYYSSIMLTTVMEVSGCTHGRASWLSIVVLAYNIPVS